MELLCADRLRGTAESSVWEDKCISSVWSVVLEVYVHVVLLLPGLFIGA